MIEQILAYINQKLMQTTLFKDVRGLCEIIEKGEQKFPAEYSNKGDYKFIDDKTNWEAGLAYHRLLGDVEPEQLDEDIAPTACDVVIRKVYHMRLICCVPKTILDNSNDDKYIDHKLVHNLENILNENRNSILENLLKLSLVQILVKRADVNRYNVFKEEYQNVKFNIGFEYAYFALEYDIILEGLQTCFENYSCGCETETYDFCSLCPQQPAPTCKGVDVTDNLHSPVIIHVAEGGAYTCITCPPFIDVVITDPLNPASPISKGSGTTYACFNINTADCPYLLANLTDAQKDCLSTNIDYSILARLIALIANTKWATNILPYAVANATCQQLNSNLTIAQRQIIAGSRSTKTGQTASLVTGDDGNIQDGRGVDFLTLSCNNPSGNTNRFEELIANFITDWQHRRVFYKLYYAAATWDNACAAVTALNAGAGLGGFNDWKILNINVAMEIMRRKNGENSCLSYAPFNITSATSNLIFWTSDYVPDLTTSAFYVRITTGGGVFAGNMSYHTRGTLNNYMIYRNMI